MKPILALLFIFTFYLLSAQFQNGGLDQWEPTSHPLYPYDELVGWVTTNGYSTTNPATNPFPIRKRRK